MKPTRRRSLPPPWPRTGGAAYRAATALLASALLTPALLTSALLTSALLTGCDETPDDVPVVVIPNDRGVGPDVMPLTDAGPDARPPPDAGPPPDAAPPPCVNPCDDGDPGTTGDRCVDDVCVGDPLPALLVQIGDAPLAGERLPGQPAAAVLRVLADGDGLRVEPAGFLAPRGEATVGADGVWLTRPLVDLARTVVLRAEVEGFAERARGPLVPAARVVSGARGSLVLIGDDGAVVHLDSDGAATPLGSGIADAVAFLGERDGQLVGRTLGAAPGPPWVVEAEAAQSAVDGQMLGGLAVITREDERLVIDVAGERQATIELAGRLRAGDGWLAEQSGDGLARVTTWPPSVHRVAVPWLDLRFVDGGVITVDADGGVWWIALGDAPSEPVERGTLPPGTGLIATHPDGRGVLAQSLAGLWFIEAGAEPTPLPASGGRFAGFLGDRALFAGADRVEAIDVGSAALTAVEGAFGGALGVVGDALWIREASPAPMRLGRLDPRGTTPLATVWTPEPRTLVDAVDWVRIGGATAAFIAEQDGPLVALDLSAPGAAPVPVARLRTGTRWSIGGVSADGRWVVWRAGDEVLGSLRGARTDGSSFPDGLELLRSRAYPVMMAPEGARLAVDLGARPSGGFPIIDLDRPDPDEATWVVSEGLGLFPLAWLDADSLLVGLCLGELECDTVGIGRVDLLGGVPVLAALVGGDPQIRFPVWGRTVLVAGGQLYYLRNSGLAQVELRRQPLDGRGGWSTVASGGQPFRLHGLAEWGVVFEAGGALWHVQLAGDATALAVPGPVVGLGPLEYERPLTMLAESGPADGAPCLDCGGWRIDREGGPPVQLGGGPLRPALWSPAGDVVVHQAVVDGRVGLALSDDTPGPTVLWPAPETGDLRVLGWMPPAP